MKRQNQVNINTFTIEDKQYKVVLENLKNTPSGCPRYRAIVIYPNDYNKVFTFNGHYLSVKDESEYILQEALKEDK